MERIGNVRILFVAGFGPIVRDVTASRKLYSDILGIPFKEESGNYLHTEALKGATSFALWPLSQAAQSCFGKDSWPGEINDSPAKSGSGEFAELRVKQPDRHFAVYSRVFRGHREHFGTVQAM